MMLVKFQQVDVPLAVAQLVRFQNRALIALALRGYLARGHRGLLMPCAYLRPKANDVAETGIAYLVGPHPDSKAVAEKTYEDWERAIGAGTSAMVLDFAREVGRVIHKAPQGTAANGVKLGRNYFLTMELRPVTSISVLDSRVAVLDSDVLITMPEAESLIDGGWDILAREGFVSLAHLPLAPVDLHADGSWHAL
jgi:hypothetical protein